MTANELIDELGEFITEPLRMVAGHGLLGPGKPRELTETVCWNGWNGEDEDGICLIDFGESFFQPIESRHLAQPLHLTVPESVFEDHVDYRADLWRAGTIVRNLCLRSSFVLTMATSNSNFLVRFIHWSSVWVPLRPWVANLQWSIVWWTSSKSFHLVGTIAGLRSERLLGGKPKAESVSSIISIPSFIADISLYH
jgi:hypothetical protein